MNEPTQDHGMPPDLLRCDLASQAYREADFVSLAPVDGFLTVFRPPHTPLEPESIGLGFE